ncbi:MAG: class I tRNA ligase family protein, partial [Aureibaculum sp.]
WGEPFPVYYVNGLPQMIDVKYLQLVLPEVEKYLPTEDGKPPLGNATHWAWDTKNNKVVSNDLVTLSAAEGSQEDNGIYPLELNTMPGWAGSSQYFNRYMDPHNKDEIFSKEAINYWQDVDLYIGGSEHATGHLLYSRFWQKFMFDRGWVPKDEYAKKLINQGMILGTSAFVYRWEYGTHNKDDKRIPVFVSKEIIEDSIKRNSFLNENDSIDKLTYKLSSIHGGKPISLTVTKWSHFTPIHADVSLVNASDELDIEAFKKWRPEFKDAEFVLEEGKYKVGREAEKMSKSKYNVVNPDAICHQYGADSLRMYEMFLGPLEQAKPWNTAGITGVHSFLKKMWKLYHKGDVFSVSDNEPTNEQI